MVHPSSKNREGIPYFKVVLDELACIYSTSPSLRLVILWLVILWLNSAKRNSAVEKNQR